MPLGRECYGARASEAKEEQWRHGLWLLEEMQRTRVEPDEISFNCLATACEREHWQLALSLLLPLGEAKKEHGRRICLSLGPRSLIYTLDISYG